MLRPKIFPTLWKTWVVYGLPHGFARHDKILPIQPPNLKKNAFPAKLIFSKCQLCHVFLPARSHSQPLAATRSHSSGRKWPQVAASGRSSQFQASGRKWPPCRKWPQVAAFCDFNFHPQSSPRARFPRDFNRLNNFKEALSNCSHKTGEGIFICEQLLCLRSMLGGSWLQSFYFMF